MIANELIASGLSQPQQALLMELVLTMSSGNSASNPVESPEYRVLEKRRAWDRERKRVLAAEKLRLSISTGNPPEDGGNPPDIAEITCDLKGKKEAFRKEGLEKKESKRGSRLLKDARMSADDRAFALTIIPPEFVESEWAEFVDYWIGVPGSRGCKLDWPATWRNRVRDLAKKYKGRNGHGTSNHRTDPAAGRATARETQQASAMARGAANRLAERNSTGPGNGMASGNAGFADRLLTDERPEDAY